VGTAGGSRGVRSPAALERSPPGFVALARVAGLVDAQSEHGDVGRIIWGRILYSPPISVANLCHMAVVADSLGEVGEGEEVAAELTVGSIWAEKGRERELDGEGRSSAGTAMAAGGGGPIPAGLVRG